MNGIEKACSTTIEVNRSKFITHLVPISEYEGLQQKLKAEHPKANHVVYALRYLNEFDQVVENSSDDGEPKGCAGVPALNVLRGEKLINCAVLIVRYFGGIKLGVGGLVRAYKTAAQLALESCTIVTKTIDNYYQLVFEYKDMNKVQRIIKKYRVPILKQDLALNCKYNIRIRKGEAEQVINAFTDLRCVVISEV